MRATLRRVKDELRRRTHWPIPKQGRWLRQVLTGFFAYHAVPTNFWALRAFRSQVTHLWQRFLSRRSQRGRPTWDGLRPLVDAWLPRPHILHPWPDQRFDVRISRRSALNPATKVLSPVQETCKNTGPFRDHRSAIRMSANGGARRLYE
jgi:hypothetical protein